MSSGNQRLRRIDIDDLRILRVLLHGGNLFDAARVNHCTQPAVTGRLRKISWVFGETNITEKGGRTLHLTDHGVQVALVANYVLRILESYFEKEAS